MTAGINISDKVAFIWSIADLLRGPYKPHQYGRVIIPMTVLRRLDCVLESTKPAVLKEAAKLKANSPIKTVEPLLCRASGQSFYNTSAFDFANSRNATIPPRSGLMPRATQSRTRACATPKASPCPTTSPPTSRLRSGFWGPCVG